MCRIQSIILPEMTPLKSDRLTGPPVPPRRDDIRVRGRTRLLCFSRIFRDVARAAMYLFLLAAIVLGAQPEPARAQTTATYTVTFKGNWNTNSTPGGVVGSAHFTTLIGAVHDSDVTFWAAGWHGHRRRGRSGGTWRHGHVQVGNQPLLRHRDREDPPFRSQWDLRHGHEDV